MLVALIYFAALRRYYMFDADHAIQIMMAKYFTGQSADFYYWGQNRLGSLIPILLIVPIKLLGLPALASAVVCSLALYLLALWLLFSHARGPFERAASLVGFFLVPIQCYAFLLYTGHPYVPAMALTLCAFTWLFHARPSIAVAFGSGLLLSLSIWVSEATVASIGALFLILLDRRKSGQFNAKALVALGLGTLTLVPCIHYWRKHIGYEGHDADYLRVITPDLLVVGLKKFLPQFSDMVNSRLPDKPLWAWLVTGMLVLVNPLVLMLRKGIVDEGPDQPRAPVMTFLALHNILYFFIMLASLHAYYGEGLIQRYWVPVIIFSIYLLMVLCARALRQIGLRRWAVVPAAPALLAIVSLTLLAVHKWPRKQAPVSSFESIASHRRDLRLVREHGATHATADYWRSIPLNVLSEFQVLAITPGHSRTLRFEDEFSPRERQAHPDRYYDF